MTLLSTRAAATLALTVLLSVAGEGQALAALAGESVVYPSAPMPLPSGLPGAQPQGEHAGADAARRVVESLVEVGLQHVDLTALRELAWQLDPSLRELAVDPERLVRSLGRQGLPGPGQVVSALGELFVRELRLNLHLMVRVLMLAVLGAVLQQLGRGLAGRAAQEVAAAAVVLALALLAVQSFGVAARMVYQAVDQMAGVARAVLPTLTSLAASSGNIWAAATLHPLLLTVVSLAAELVQRVVVPALLVGGALGVASTLSPEFPMSRLAGLAQRVALVVLGLCLTVFLGVVAVRGGVGPVADGVTLRTVKFLTGSTVPVVGRMMSEAVEVVAGASGLLGAAVGAAGVALVLLVAAAPTVKLLAVMAIFSTCAALLEPVGERRVQAALGVLGDTLGLLLAGLAVCTVLFLVAVSSLAGLWVPWRSWGL